MNRRTFLQAAALAAGGNLSGLRPFGALSALAQSPSTADYKALVCVFLNGGNDANNMIVPTDDTTYGLYATGRGELALAQGELLPLGGTNFGLHPSMPELAGLFQSKRMAVLANVGPLVVPVTAAEILNHTAGPLPEGISSHTNQQAVWQTATQSSEVSTGWGGKITDKLGPSYGSQGFPMSVSVAGTSLLTSGETTQAFVVSPSLPSALNCSEGPLCDARQRAAEQLITFNSGVTLVQASAAVKSDMYAFSEVYSKAIAQGTAIQAQFPKTPLSTQLRQIARILQVRNQLGPRRQIFFASLGGFDTHTNQLGAHASLLAQLSQALQAFQLSLVELGLEDQVTTFTMSDFARTLRSNSGQGSDHAWGGHQMILGGAVKGGSIYGTFPNLLIGGPSDSADKGIWVPTSSVAQYGATLASWFGVADADLPYAFDVLPNFSVKNLNFI